MNNEIKVTVVMPIYNEADYLAPALDSVLDQTLREIEVICVDDGSNDGSLKMLKEYQAQDKRVRIVTETNAGPSLARNNGLRRARGEFIAFLDADDFYAPTLLEELYNLAVKNELDIAIAGYDIYNSKKATFERAPTSEHEYIYKPGAVVSKNNHPDEIFTSTNGAAWNKLFRRSFVIDKNLTFIKDVRMYEDVYFTVNALSLAERVGMVNKVLLHHRIYSEQSRAKAFRKYYPQVPEIYVCIKEFLMHNGMYSPLSRSFLNLSASRCYKTFNMLGQDLKDNFWNLLHDKYAEQLNWGNYLSEEFFDDEVRDFVANVVVYDYKQYKRRLEKGRTITSAPKADTALKTAKSKKKWRGFFSKIFHKKKG